MNRERPLSLVKPGDAAPSAGAEHTPADLELLGGEPPTEAELREAEALRKSMERGDDPFASALRAAFDPAPIESPDLDAILARAMGDLDAPATSIEEREAERLRVALDEHDALREGRLAVGPGARRAPEGEPAAVAVALRAAWAPSAISTVKNDALVSRALSAQDAASHVGSAHPQPAARKAANDGADAPAPISLRRFRLGRRSIATMTAVVAMAAGALLFMTRMGQRDLSPPASVAQAPAARSAEVLPKIASRSTTDLFDATTPFPRQGGESARVDRIAGARASDLRANRFAAWGVR